MSEKKKQNPEAQQVTFARSLGLFDATMIGVGAMIGAGIFVLTGLAAGEAGPASILAFALNGVVTLLTAFAYAELASAVPRAGGGYSFVRMAFPGAAGFISGWMLWFAYTVACSLYALGFAGYFWEFFHKYVPGLTESLYSVVGPEQAVLAVTFLIGVMFTWLNVRGAEVTGKTENILTISKIIVLAVFIFYGLRKIMEQPTEAMESFTPFFPTGLGGVIVAMGLTFIAFEGYDLIATVAEEIKQPEKNIPRATFIALGMTVLIYLLILFVSLGAVNPDGLPGWQFLGKFKETAIVRAAEGFMPAFGVAVIVFGGLLSTMSALNATVMAASRVAFSMGRDLWLPKRMATINVKTRTPHVAIFVTGIILVTMALTLPIEAVGSAASLIF
ncbi:MAG: amino acid permease, partial [candidate division Zixibacteria bacterium]|nr:amino acid permease [candidate division Zixibacteria bacterium]